jgi:outer membrane protein
MRRWTKVVSCLLVAVAPVAARAQGPGLTLEEAIARATANSLRLAEFESREAAAAAVEQRRAADRQPSVAFTGRMARTNHVQEFSIATPGQPPRVIYPDIPDNYRMRLDLAWPIYTGGRVDALERAALAEREAAGEDLAGARADLRLEVARAYWAAVTSRETEIVLARALENIGAHVRDLRARLDQGLIPPNELLSAEAQQSRQRMLAIEAGNAREIADADLRRLLGVRADEPVAPAARLEIAPSAGAAPDALVEEARGSRPERRGLEDRASAARARIEAASAAFWPQLSVNGGYDYARPNPRILPLTPFWRDSWDVGVNVSWSLFDGGRTKADRAEAVATARAAEARVGDFDRQLEFEVRQRRLESASSRAAVDAAADGVRAAAEALRVVNERFRVGVATSTEVLDAETALLQAELDRTRALASARLADARLARAVGR